MVRSYVLTEPNGGKVKEFLIKYIAAMESRNAYKPTLVDGLKGCNVPVVRLYVPWKRGKDDENSE